MKRGALIITLLVLASCSFRENKEGASQPLAGRGAVSYAKIQSAILKPFCVGCHGGMHAPNLSNYAFVKENLQSVGHSVLEKRNMPKSGPLSEDLMQLLKEWIDNGAPEFAETPDPVPTTPVGGDRPVVKWADVCREVFRPKCFNCHFDNNPQSISNLDNFDTFVETVGTSFYVTVVNSLMPPPPPGTPEGEPNPNKLTRAELEMFSNWIVDGMQR